MIQKRKYILSIDGGGIRGIIPIIALMKLESETGKLTRDIFSFVAGTSTGAIIAAAIACGIPTTNILELYTGCNLAIFHHYPWTLLKRFFHGYMYSTEKLHEIIRKQIKDVSLNKLPIDILLTAKRVRDSMPWYFVKGHSCNLQQVGKLKLVDCVTASAAAPTYFKPWAINETITVRGQQERIGTLVDGGAGVAGNPVYQAAVEAFYYHTDYIAKNTTIVSLGTGRFVYEAKPGWLPEWIGWILNELLRSPSEQQTEITHRHFDKSLLYRLDPDLKTLDPSLKRHIRLDDIDMVDELKKYGHQFAALVNWQKILDGKDTQFRIFDQNTQWCQYKKP